MSTATFHALPAVIAGPPASNGALYHRIRFSVGDPAALIEIPGADGGAPRRVLIIRDIEVDRARRHARADEVHPPADFEPEGGFSADREIATAQALAECLRRRGIAAVRGDRSLALVYAEAIRDAGIAVEYDPDLGVTERRSKDAQEIEWLREAQSVTEGCMAMACGMIARASARRDGTLEHGGDALTSERIRVAIDAFLTERGYANPESIVAGGKLGADCHDRGRGPLRSGELIIVDIFPRNKQTGYHGDCTRTVVHGEIPAEAARMHRTVVEAKSAAIAALRPGTTGDAIHAAATAVIRAEGYGVGLPPLEAGPQWCGMTHGTGHGIGLDVHEPPLLVAGGTALVLGDALTIEPGLYCAAIGGVRVEDLVIVGAEGPINLNRLPEGLDCWR
ncbi:MAG TPA: Xaa-Pro peptidase family protein [Phycisphaerales bacterium]|nr:Xaa-Pro peptidase family protein [Phycisphaerales bacterium]HMP37189.1 Xaa-Pro peptidase family protein [Phycisphaerales bacterium]